MREYRLASNDYRNTVDLRDYATIITDTVHAIVPSAVVTVKEDCYIIETELTQSQIVQIGRALAKSILGKFCALRPVLFTGTSVLPQPPKDRKHPTPKTKGGRYGRKS